MQIDKNVIRAIRQQVESFPAASYDAFNERLNKAKDTISRLTSFSERDGGLPQFDHVSRSAYSALTSDGFSVENCFLYAYAAGLYWAESDWLDPYRYTTIKGTTEMMSALINYDNKAETHIFLSSVPGEGPKDLSYFGEWHRILYVRLSYGRKSMELEVYPLQEKSYVTLDSINGNVFRYRDEDNHIIYALIFNGDFLSSVSISYFDESWSGEKTYIYSSNDDQPLQELPQVIDFNERIIRIRSEFAVESNESDTIRDYLRDQGVHYFYHFTDRHNIESIKENGGLFSWKFLKEHGIAVHNPGGDPTSRVTDQRMGLHDYVRLSFCENHPMAYAISKRNPGAEYVLLKIKPDVACFDTTLFCDMNAVDKLSQRGPGIDSLKRVNIAATKRKYVNGDDADFKYKQAEVLCKKFVPIEYILNLDNPTPIVFNS